MSAQTPGSERRSPATSRPERAPRALRILALAAVCTGLAALAAATFVLSYRGIHVLALQAGITPRLARGYPLLIDAMLVISAAAVLALRGAGLPSKLLAWATLLAVLAAAAGADALHADGRKLPHHVAAITAAVLPWLLLFLAFALLLAMLRHARLRQLGAARGQKASRQAAPAQIPAQVPALELPARQPLPAASIVPGLGQGGVGPVTPGGPVPDPAPPGPAVPDEAAPHTAAPDPALPDPAGSGPAMPGPDAPGPDAPDLAAPDETAPDLAASAEEAAAGASGEPQPAVLPVLVVTGQAGAPSSATAADPGTGAPGADQPDLAIEAEVAPDDPSSDEQEDPDMPVFHRMRSSPTPPARSEPADY